MNIFRNHKIKYYKTIPYDFVGLLCPYACEIEKKGMDYYKSLYFYYTTKDKQTYKLNYEDVEANLHKLNDDFIKKNYYFNIDWHFNGDGCAFIPNKDQEFDIEIYL